MTSRFSTGIEGNYLTSENKLQKCIQIGKLFHICSILITFCNGEKLPSEPAICPCISPISSPIVRQARGILRRDISRWGYLGIDSSHVTDALGGYDHGNRKTITKRDWRRTWRLQSNEIWGQLGIGWSSDCRLVGRGTGSWDSIHWLYCNLGNVDRWAQ